MSYTKLDQWLLYSIENVCDRCGYIIHSAYYNDKEDILLCDYCYEKEIQNNG